MPRETISMRDRDENTLYFINRNRIESVEIETETNTEIDVN